MPLAQSSTSRFERIAFGHTPGFQPTHERKASEPNLIGRFQQPISGGLRDNMEPGQLWKTKNGCLVLVIGVQYDTYCTVESIDQWQLLRYAGERIA